MIQNALSEKYPDLHFFLSLDSTLAEFLPETISFKEGEKPDVIYLIGAEIFHHALDLLKQEHPPQILLIEPDCSKLGFFFSKPFANTLVLHSKVSVFSSFPPQALEILLEKAALSFPFSSFCLYTASSRFDQHALENTVAKLLTLQRSLLSEGILAPTIYKNVIHQFVKLSEVPSLGSLKGTFQGIPAVICGAGPSLIDALPFLRSIQDRALLIAGGSAISILNYHGIFPHIQCIADPQEKEYRIVKGAYSFQSPVLLEGRARFNVDNTYNGKEIIAPHAYHESFVSWFIERAKIHHLMEDEWLGGISVTTFALDAALHFGVNPIFLVGVDLAYGQKKKYAEGAAIEEGALQQPQAEIRKTEEDLLVTQSHFGKEVLTQTRWVIESQQLSEKAERNPHRSLFTLSREGLGFSNIPYISMEEARQQYLYKQWDLEAILHQALSLVHPASKENCPQILSSLGKSLERVHSLFQENYREATLDYFLEQEVAYEVLLHPIWKSIERILRFEKGIPKNSWMVHTVRELLIIFQEEGLL